MSSLRVLIDGGESDHSLSDHPLPTHPLRPVQAQTDSHVINLLCKIAVKIEVVQKKKWKDKSLSFPTRFEISLILLRKTNTLFEAH